MERTPSFEEVNHVVLELDGDSTSGPNGLSRIFFQFCWEIIREDVTRKVKAFFFG